MFLDIGVFVCAHIAQGHLEKIGKQTSTRGLMRCLRRVTTGHNGDDERGSFAGFLSRHQRIGTR
jgi:hypothetical protein